MKQYPSIDKNINRGIFVYAFDKLDGSNLRVEWSNKKGFHKFGSRTQLIDSSSPILGEGVLLLKKLEEQFHEVLKKEKVQKSTLFFEFFGKNSFSGKHVEGEAKEVKLIDLSIDNKGILFPKEFLKLTSGLPTALILYQGFLNEEFINKVKNGTLPFMTFEGVICKANQGSPGLPLMFKIKNQAWLNKLQEQCQGDMALFERLS